MDGISLEGVTLLADDVGRMADFFEHTLGFEVQVREAQYVAVAGTGIRLAIFPALGHGRAHSRSSVLR
jgi:catechol-2,3-dioxygenase